MGVLRAISDFDDGGRAAAGAWLAGDLQCFALDGAGGLSVAFAAARSAAVDGGASAKLTLVRAGCFEAMAHDLRMVLREFADRTSQPSAVILDGRTVQSTLESGARAGYDGQKRRKGAKVHIAADTLGHLLALKVTPANAQERAQVGALASSPGRHGGQREDQLCRPRLHRSGTCR